MSIIPLEYYTPLYFHFLLIVIVFFYFKCFSIEFNDDRNLKLKNIQGIFLVLFVLMYIGLRPISGWFGDMVIYNKELLEYTSGKPLEIKKDALFEIFKFYCATRLSAETFFFLSSFIYVVALYYATKKMFNVYWYYCFLGLICSFSFWAYGVNGIRNGVASSLFILAISRNNNMVKWIILIACIYIHISMLLPVGAYFLALIFKKIDLKYFFIFWLFSIVVSLVSGGFWESFFMNIGLVEENKITGYLGDFNKMGEGVELKVGFRWDFLLYSASGVYAAWFFTFKRKIEDFQYKTLIVVYLLVNAFWILVIRANYSNRFAYLSWFLLSIIIFYPLLKYQLYKNQHKVIGNIMLMYFTFTYLFNVILG